MKYPIFQISVSKQKQKKISGFNWDPKLHMTNSKVRKFRFSILDMF